uniref:NADH dehydrogenase subunit 6 n=1 Tax=Pleuropoma jana TaxID=1882665 RepID=A0A1B2G3A1_9GAST|nr:NADH dehydrogenase subunit 6 [Pleuropoma jana]
MMSLFISSVLMAFLFFMPFMAKPLSLGLIVILIVLFWCILVNVCLSSWFSYVIFMIYVGAMLVMFIYVSSLIPNSKFKFDKLMFIFFVSFLSIFFIFINFSFVSLCMSPSVWLKNQLFLKIGLVITSRFNISSLFSLILVLLFVLVIVVKICNLNGGALRRFNYA